MSRQLALASPARRLLLGWPVGSKRAGAVAARETSGCPPAAAGDEGKKNVVTERHGTIMTIGINRPETRNAVNQETAAMLLQAFTSFEVDNSLTVAVLHGIGSEVDTDFGSLLFCVPSLRHVGHEFQRYCSLPIAHADFRKSYEFSGLWKISPTLSQLNLGGLRHKIQRLEKTTPPYFKENTLCYSLQEKLTRPNPPRCNFLDFSRVTAGGNFCAGYDLKELAHNPTSIKLEQDVTKGPGPMGPSRIKFSKPVIAAVSGYAVAGGLELSLLADLRVVEQSAIFGVFCRRFGVPLIDGGTVRLPRLIGLSRALDLILTGRPVGAQEAYELGLANRIVPNGQALQCAIELAKQISAFPQQCMHGDRNSAYYSVFDATSFTEAMQFEFDTGVQVILKESVSGAKKFSLGEGRGGKL